MFEEIGVYKYNMKSKRKETSKCYTCVSKCRRARASSSLYVNWEENNEVEINEVEGNQTAEV